MGNWFSEPLREVFGIPTFWIARSAKLILFLSGWAILIEIIGKTKIEEMAGAIRTTITNVKKSNPVWNIFDDLRFSGRVFYYTWLSRNEEQLTLLNLNKRENESSEGEFDPWEAYGVYAIWLGAKAHEEKTQAVSLVLTLILAIGILLYLANWLTQWNSLLQIAGSVVLILLLIIVIALFSFSIIYLLILILMLSIIIIVLFPLKWLLDCIASVTTRILKKQDVSRRLLVIAFVFLMIGFILDLLSS